ncbi:MAG TPA: hypothetical protein VF607_10240, partial [Verrucomicrobiae bacterium]
IQVNRKVKKPKNLARKHRMDSLNPWPLKPAVASAGTINPGPSERVIIADAALSTGKTGADKYNTVNYTYLALPGGWAGGKHQSSHLGAVAQRNEHSDAGRAF